MRKKSATVVDLDSSSLCDVLLDSVIHSGHVAAIHAEQANCRQCREFVFKFRTDLKLSLIHI